MEALVSALLAAGLTVGWLQPKIKRSETKVEALSELIMAETDVLRERIILAEKQLEGVDTQVLAKTVALITPVAQATAQLKQTVGI